MCLLSATVTFRSAICWSSSTFCSTLRATCLSISSIIFLVVLTSLL
uniref:Uncharacterized protein n=1 Tax=Anguilla anguilla TaxID=7936 RepID=A0A0E9UKS7_ANGAN